MYEEFLLFQLKMQALRKIERENSNGISQEFDVEKVDKFIDIFPFPLTNAQKRVVNEILTDLKVTISNESSTCKGMLDRGKQWLLRLRLFASCYSRFSRSINGSDRNFS